MRNSISLTSFLLLLVAFVINIDTTNAQCTNTSFYGSANAPTTSAQENITTCNSAGEYSTIFGISFGQSYAVTSSNCTDYITVYDGNGTLVNHGNTPLLFSATTSGDYTVHWSEDASCGTGPQCRETNISCMSCGATSGCTDPTAINYDASASFDDCSCNYQGLGNDDCTGAYDLSAYMNFNGTCSAIATGHNIGATNTTGEIPPSQQCTDGDPTPLDIWYSVTVPSTGAFTFQFMLTPGFSALAELYTGSCGNLTAYSPVLCNSLVRRTWVDLTPGSVVYIRVWDFISDEEGNFEFCLIEETPGCTDTQAVNYDPNATVDDGSCNYGTNDKVCDSPILSVNGACTVGDNTGQNVESGEPEGDCFYPFNYTTWFQFEAVSNYTSISTDFAGYTSNDTEIALYEATDCGDYTSFTLLACDQDMGDIVNYNSIISNANTVAGQMYYVQVSGYDGAEGTFCIQATSAPNNDGICDGQVVTCGETITENTNDYSWNTVYLPPGNCTSGNVTAPNAFYKYIGDGNDVIFDLCSSDFDTKLDVYCMYDGDCASYPFYACMDGNDNDSSCGTGGGSYLRWRTVVGVEYFVMVHGNGTATGNFTLNVSCETPEFVPANQDCDANGIVCRFQGEAEQISINQNCIPTSGTNENAFAAFNTPNCGGFGGLQFTDVWYRFNSGSETDVTVTLTEGTAINAHYAIYMQCGGVVQYCDDPIVTGLSPNTTYYVQVFTEQGNEGTFDICITPPQVPPCTAVTNPSNSPVGVNELITWDDVTTAEGYKISVGTSSGADDYVVLTDVGDALSYNTPTFDFNTTYYLKVTPYNIVGDALDCEEVMFTTVCSDLNLMDYTIQDGNCGNNNAAIDIDIDGGVGPFDYAWTGPNGYTNAAQDISNVGAGSYNVIITDMDNDCTVSESFMVETTSEITTSSSVQDAGCIPDGMIDLTVDGGSGNYTYAWTGPNGFTSSSEDLNNLGAGNYNVTVLDNATNCEETDAFTITATTSMADNSFITNESCGDDAAIDVSVSGGSGNYTYSWTGPNGFTSNAEDIVNVEGGDYQLSVIDNSNNCEAIYDYTVFGTSSIESTANIMNGGCGDLGAIDLSVTGGAGGYFYIWSGPNNFSAYDEDISNLTSGMYTVSIYDINACLVTQEYMVTSSSDIAANEILTNPSCFNDGQININAAGGNGPYTYQWQGPNGFNSASQNVANLIAGTYNLTITDDNSACEGLYAFTLDNQVAFADAPTVVDEMCGNDGAIDVVVSGGVGPYDYAWIGPNGFSANTNNITELRGGAYTLLVTDMNNGCSGVFNYVVDDFVPIASNATVTNEDCSGPGNIQLNVGGGSGSYTYNWSGPFGFGAVTQDLSFAISGDYSVTITDTNGCEKIDTYTVDMDTPMTSDAVVTDATCTQDGAIDVTVTGGGNYNYSWSGPQGFNASSEDVNNLAAGNYFLVITDLANNCQISSNYTIESMVQMEDAVTVVDEMCGNDGAISLSVSGGVGPYEYQWNGPNGFNSNNANITELRGGAYDVIVTDMSNNCTTVFNYSLNAFVPINSDATITDGDCSTAGAIDVMVTGGEGNYTYNWSGPNNFNSTNQNLSNVAPGIYTLILTDANNCNQTFDYVVNTTETMAAAVNLSNATCTNDGAIDISVTGGVGPYAYAWTGPQGFTANTEDVNTLFGGDYSVVVSDMNSNCEVTYSYTVETMVQMVDAVSTVDEMCGNDGAISLSVTGGVGPYEYQWNGPSGFNSNASDIDELRGGVYDVIVTDMANNCSTVFTYTIGAFVPMDATANITDGDCDTATAIDVMVTGGTGNLSYSWSGPNGFTSSDQNLSGVNEGTYTLMVTDANNCNQTFDYTVNSTAQMASAVNLTDATCTNDGAIDVTVTGGVGPYTYAWTGPQGFTANTEDVNTLFGGDYSVVVSDMNSNCEVTYSYTVETMVQMVDAVSTVDEMCGNDGAISLSVTGGVGPYEYQWNGPSGFNSNASDIDELRGGVYDVIVTDMANNCSSVFTYTIGTFVPMDAAANITDGDCDTATAIDVAVTGGAGSYAYAWTGPNGFTSSDQNLTNINAGNYTLVVTDANNCNQTFDYSVNSSVMVSADAMITDSNCNDEGAIDVTVMTGMGTYTYSWTGPNGFTATTEDLINISGGDYTLMIMDVMTNCEVSYFFSVDAIANISTEFTATDEVCGMDGTLSVEVDGGSGNYFFQWDGPNGVTSFDQSLIELEGGMYELTVMDLDNGCQAYFEYELAAGTNTIQTAAFIDDGGCGENAYVNLTVTGGTGDYTYQWTGPNDFTAESEDISSIEGGMYEVNITDMNTGCVRVQEFMVDATVPMTATYTSANEICGNDGSIDVTMAGGTPPYDFSWSHGDTTEDPQDLPNGSYSVSIVDANNCFFTLLQISIETDPNLTATIDEVIDQDCNNGMGSVTMTPTNGTAPYHFIWESMDGSIFQGETDVMGTYTMTDLPAGDYEITITGAEGCSGVYNATINGDETVDIATTMVSDLACATDENGIIEIEINGGVMPYLLEWSNGETGAAMNSQASIDNLTAGEYTVTIVDANGCTAISEMIMVDAPSSMDVTIELSPTDLENIIDAEVFVTGGTAPYTYQWSQSANAQTGNIAFDLELGMHSVTITDANGCTFIEMVENIVTVATTELDDLIDVTLAPNPTKGLAQLHIELGQTSDLNVEIFSIIGQQIMEINETNFRKGMLPINMTDYPEGVYLVRLTVNNNQILTKRLVVSH